MRQLSTSLAVAFRANALIYLNGKRVLMFSGVVSISAIPFPPLFGAACVFANWELTTPDCPDAVPLNYQDEQTIPRMGL